MTIEERLFYWIAFRTPKRLAFYIACRVVTWASVTRYQTLEFGTITAQKALICWYNDWGLKKHE